jgi:GNAT superfamily N-acetyltransferase
MLDQRHVVIAERGERAAGYAYFDFLGVLNPFLAMIWVFDEYRGIGISRDILVFLEDHFRRGGHEVLYSSSRADGAVPQAWHRHMGFEECGFIIGLGEGDVGEVYFRKRLR